MATRRENVILYIPWEIRCITIVIAIDCSVLYLYMVKVVWWWFQRRNFIRCKLQCAHTFCVSFGFPSKIYSFFCVYGGIHLNACAESNFVNSFRFSCGDAVESFKWCGACCRCLFFAEFHLNRIHTKPVGRSSIVKHSQQITILGLIAKTKCPWCTKNPIESTIPSLISYLKWIQWRCFWLSCSSETCSPFPNRQTNTNTLDA